MFSIVRGGKVIGLCDKPRYVRGDNGVFVETDRDRATHVAFRGTAYALSDTLVVEKDSAEFAFDESGRLIEAEGAITDLENAACEESMAVDERLADVENAICELSEAFFGE